MPISSKLLFPLILAAGLSAAAATADDNTAGANIYQHCKTCHGPEGEGGRDGVYPRIAALPQAYIERQLASFKSQKRLNKPMVPIFKNWRFDRDAMAAVAAHIAAMPEPEVPAFQPSAQRLADFDSRQEFDELGRDLFVDNCVQCHGEDGRGRADKEAPPLVNQYPAYLRKQMGDFVNGRREHEHAAKMFGELYEEEVDALLAHLGRLSRASAD